jgi:hypothetical protein
MKVVAVYDGHLLRWHSDYVSVYVLFEADGRASGIVVRRMRRAHQSPLAMVRRWLRR